MNNLFFSWRNSKLTHKFTLTFSLLLILIVLMTITSLVALVAMRRKAVVAISTATQVQQLALEARPAEELIDRIEREAQNAQAEIDRTGRLAGTLLITAGMISLILAGLVITWANTNLSHNLRNLTTAATYLQQGRLDTQVQLDSTDELGYLADTLNLLAGRINFLASELETKATEAQVRLLEAEALNQQNNYLNNLLNVVIPIGVALSAEQNFDRLLEKILLEAKRFCHADAGTLYLRTEDDELRFVILRNDTLNLAMGGTSGTPINFPAIPLYDKVTGEANHHNVAAYVALTGASINIPDAYEAAGFNFSGTKAFDSTTGYRSVSFLTAPLKNVHNQVVGVLQLINAKAPRTGEVIPFDHSLEQIATSLASLATVALEAYIREQSLRQQIQQLRIEIDAAKQQKQVNEIVETDFFQDLQNKARQIRRRLQRDRFQG